MEPAAVRSRLVFAALCGALAGGCSLARQADDVHVSSAGASVTSYAAPALRGVSSAGSLTESRTASLALDRIDQVDLPLDHTYRHFGTGRGVTVYVFDGGVLESHPELAGRVRRGFDAFPGDERLCNAHGTAVAGAVAGTTLGVAPEANVVDVKMVECRRMRGSVDAIVRATQWVLEDHARHPDRRAVANWSFVADTGASIPALDTAVTELRAAGIPVIVSAGNVDTDACHVSPGNAPGAIVVGASRIFASGTKTSRVIMDARAPHTAFGPCIDVFAPGDSVLLPGLDPAGTPNAQLWSGTSMSAGYVSGAAALFLESHPRATVDDVRGQLLRGGNAVDGKSPRAGMLYVGSN